MTVATPEESKTAAHDRRATAAAGKSPAPAPSAPAAAAKGVGMADVWKGLGIALTAVLLLGALVTLQKKITISNGAREPEPRQVVDEAPVSLGGAELLALGREALASNDLDLARQMLEEARVPVGEGDFALQIEIFEGLAEIARRQGDDDLARLYDEHADRLRSRLGSALELLGGAESALAGGRHEEAVRLAASFLLRADELDERAQTFLPRARAVLAESWTRRFDAAAPDAPRLVAEPELWPHAR